MRRQRKIGESMRYVDEETRRLVANERLQQLERDQAATAVDAVGIDNDIWVASDESDADGKLPSKRKSSAGGPKTKLSNQAKAEVITTKGQRRSRRTIEMVLMDEPASLPNKDTFVSVEAPPASRTPGARPPYKLCSVCSYLGAYKCVRCGSNFCSIECNSIHRETKCLKFAD